MVQAAPLSPGQAWMCRRVLTRFLNTVSGPLGSRVQARAGWTPLQVPWGSDSQVAVLGGGAIRRVGLEGRGAVGLKSQ